MRLSTRLFLFVAILLLFLSLAVYLVPIYLLKRHNQEDQRRYLVTMEKERAEAQRRYSDWIAQEVATREASINAFLYLVSGHSQIQGELLREGKVTESIWVRSSRLLRYSEQLTFLEVEQDNRSAAITLSRTRLYLARPFLIDADLAWMAIGSLREPKDQQIYLGVWLPSLKAESDQPAPDEEAIPQIYLLFDPVEVYKKGTEYVDRLARFKKWLDGPGKETPKVAHDLSIGLFQRLESARQYLLKQFGPPDAAHQKKLEIFLESFDRNMSEPTEDPEIPEYLRRLLVKMRTATPFLGNAVPAPFASEPSSDAVVSEFYTTAFLDEIRRINDLELIAALGYLSSAGAIYVGPFDKDAPIGAARLVPGQRAGTAVLSVQAFSSDPLFDAVAHLERFPPTADSPRIGSGFGLIDRKEAGALTVVNVLELGGSQDKDGIFLTLGTSLNQVLARLAEISGETSVLVHGGRIVGKVQIPGISFSIETGNALTDQLQELRSRGFVTLAGTDFYYTSYKPDPNWDARFFTFQKAESLTAPMVAFEERSKELTLEVSRHIIAVAIGVFVVALLILELLTRHFTRPIRQLARATQQVAEGKLDAVELPKASARSKNEVATLTCAFRTMIQKLRDREKLRSVLNKVVSKEIADEILKGRVHLGGEVREVTVLFADIRGFSTITENLPPDEVIVFINSYMTVMTEVIERYQGVIDKYVGDEVMALFGAPVLHSYSGLQAILAALVMRDTLRAWNQERTAHGIVTADVGIGIHTGEMVAGNMGAEDRLNYTVMGANVNLASRLCEEAGPQEILIAEQMLDHEEIAKIFDVEEKITRTFKGFSQPIKVYGVKGLKPELNLAELTTFVQQFREVGAPPWDSVS